MVALTKEEKKARKEAKKLEKLKAEEEARKELKRQELRREVAVQIKKRGELDKSWRDMMLKVKEPIFRQEIEVMWNTFERVYDKKDHLIKHIVKLCGVADDQFQRTVASFCDTIDTMINKFLQDLENLEKDNQRRTETLLKRGEDEANTVMADHNVAETHLQLLIFFSHNTADNLAWTTRGENMVKADEERGKFANDRELLRSMLENDYNNMWEEYKAVLKAYVVGTSDNQKKVRKLRLKENMMADIIASQGKKIANSDAILRRLRVELAAYESGTKQAAFRERRNRHRIACFRLKKRLINGCALDERQMAILVKATDDTLDWIKNAHKKGDKILRMAALCRKLESQYEKVLPFGSYPPHSPTCMASSSRRQQTDDCLVSNALASSCGLTRLWQRISKAELTRRALLREKQLLEEQNELIEQHLEEPNDSKFQPETLRCKCTNHGNKKNLKFRPVAIEGVHERKKMLRY